MPDRSDVPRTTDKQRAEFLAGLAAVLVAGDMAGDAEVSCRYFRQGKLNALRAVEDAADLLYQAAIQVLDDGDPWTLACGIEEEVERPLPRASRTHPPLALPPASTAHVTGAGGSPSGTRQEAHA